MTSDREKSKDLIFIVLAMSVIVLFIGLVAISEKGSRSNNTNQSQNFFQVIDWAKIARDLVTDYQGKIVSIEQLNETTCWAVLSSNISNEQSVQVAENIGYYVRNVTGGLKGETPSVHVFRDGQHIAIARPIGNGYSGKLEFDDWDPSAFHGQYKP